MGSHLWGVSVTRRIEHSTGESQLVQHSRCSDVFLTFSHPGGLWRQFLPLCYAPGMPRYCLDHVSWPGTKLPELSWQTVWVATYTPAAVTRTLPEAVTQRKVCPLSWRQLLDLTPFSNVASSVWALSVACCVKQKRSVWHAAFGFLWLF